MRKLYRIAVVLLAIGSLFIPGHLRHFLGWTGGFLCYSLAFVLMGWSFYFARTCNWVYLGSVGLLVICLPVFTWVDYRDFWYPHIMPFFILLGTTGFLTGYFIAKKSLVPAITTAAALILCNIYFSFRIDHYVNRTFFNPHSYKSLLTSTFSADSLLDLNGRPLERKVFANKVVIMDFWFIQCASCMEKIPVYDSLYHHYKERDDIIFLSVVDGSINKLSDLREFLSRRSIQCPVVYDMNGLSIKKSGVVKRGYPVEIRIGKDGRIMQIIAGCPNKEIYYKESVKVIDELLKIN